LKRRLTVALAALASLLAAQAASAHEYWLAPSVYRAAAGDTVAITAWAGTGFRGEAKPCAPSRIVKFTLRGARELDLARAARNGDLQWARFVAPDAGGALVAYQSNFAEIELPSSEFDRYLGDEGLDQVRARRVRDRASGTVRERYARCPKTWIAGAEPGRALAPVGLAYELVPERDPGAPGALAVRALFRGRPLAGALVRAWRRDLAPGSRPFDAATRDSVPPLLRVRTDAHGVATLALSGAGEWLIASVHMVPSGDGSVADWESYWASITFARSAP
jgi:uncharacterized GH25 family protein